jgi:hypothetical protein
MIFYRQYVLGSAARSSAICLAAGLICLGAASGFGQIIPARRTVPWSSATVGVPPGLAPTYSNGVPYRTTIFTNAATAGCDTNGLVDCAPLLGGLIAACPAGQVVYVPAGKYLCNEMVNIGKTSEVTLRGAGVGRTIIIDGSTASRLCLFWIGSGNPEGSVRVVGGMNTGSSNLIVTATSAGGYSLFPGCMITVGHADDTNFVHNLVNQPYWGAPTSNTNNLTQVTMVTAINGTNISIWPPLIWNFTNTLNPWCCIFAPGTAFHDSIEDLTITHSNSLTGAVGQCQDSIFAIQCSQCWLRNVESAYVQAYHFLGYYLNQFTVRDCYFHEAANYGPSQGAGLVFYQWCCNSLVENNIYYRCSPAVEINGASSDNVFSYNYSYETLDCPPASQSQQITLADFDCNHGAHNVMNLWEGNVGPTFQSDSYFGSCSHQTLFRNYFSAAHALANQFLRAIDLCEWSDYFNIVGNVLGSPAVTNLSGQLLWSGGGGIYDMSAPNYSYNLPVIYRFGYPHLGNTSYTTNAFNPLPSDFDASDNGPRDLKVEATVLLLDNYDYVNHAVINPTNNLPASLFYASQPCWWTGKNWPPIGPDLTPMVSPIPAQARFNAIMHPPPIVVAAPSPPRNLHIPQ